MHLSGHSLEFLPSHLPYGLTKTDMAEAFGEVGEVSQVHLVLDR